MRTLLVAAVACGLAAGQTAKFEAADVHASPAGTTQSGGFLPNGRAEFRGVPLLQLISVAYSVPADRIAGGPPWLATERFDVVAKAPGKASAAVMQAMLKALLAERFELAVKQDEKPVPVYALVVAKAGAAKKSTGDGEAECRGGQEEQLRFYACRNVSIASLAERLRALAPAYFDKPVVDRTGIEGTYDFRLEWLPRAMAQASGGMTIFTSLEKQLGLKVEAATAPLPVLAVERANRTPTANSPDAIAKLGEAPKEFDVATIRPSRPGEMPDADVKNGRVEAHALTLKELIAFAYDVEEEWVKGGEKWVETERYTISAKTEPTASVDTLRTMLQALLAERFRLKAHKEPQPVSVFALTAVKPKLKDADPAGRPGCKTVYPDGGRTFVCTNVTMAEFAEKVRPVAAAYLDHPVVDLTGLTGRYDFSASWVARQALMGGEAGADRPVGLTVFEAMEKQLGLKLAAQKHPMPVIVIDSVERRPTEN